MGWSLEKAVLIMYAMKKMKNNNKIWSICSLSVLFLGLVIALFLVFAVFIVEWWTVFAAMLVFSILILLFLAGFVWSVVHLVWGLLSKRKVTYSVSPLIINVLMFFLIVFIPFSEIGHELMYLKNVDAYNEVIQMIQDGSFEEAGRLWKLPAEYSYLSDGGEIVFEENQEGFCIMFYIVRGLSISSHNGYIFCSGGTTPNGHDIEFNVDAIVQKDENWHWFYVD